MDSSPPTVAHDRSASRGSAVSVVVPIWREAAPLPAFIESLRALDPALEIVISVADASTGSLAALGARGVRWVESERPNRGRQLDLGAAAAGGDWLLFHHIDTELTAAHLQSLQSVIAAREIVGGAFYRRFDERHPALRWLEPVERWHNRSFGPLFGDQSIFARRDVFARLGGFRGLPLMEDVDFSLRLRRAGRVALLDPPIASSPRRHFARGAWRTTFQNAACLALFRLGVPAARLHAWYYSQHAASDLPPAAHPVIAPASSPKVIS